MTKMDISRRLQAELKAVETILPEISDSDLHGDFDISNVQKLDLLITEINSICTDDIPTSDLPFLIPNLSILRILLTLATRVSHINWVDDHNSNDIISSGSEREAVGDSTTLIPMRSRAMRWFHMYFSLMKRYDSLEDEFNPLYEQLHRLFEEFIVVPDFVATKISERAASKTARKGISSAFKSPTGILQMLENSPRRKTVQKSPISPSVVNNSEDEAPLLIEPRILEEEIETAYQQFLPSKKRKSDTEPKHLGDSFDLLSGNHSPRKNSPSPAMDNDTNDSASSRLFEDNLLTWKLNPTSNKGYSIWSLLEWTFYCAEKSSHTSASSVDYHSSLYKNYKEFLEFVFEFLNYDLNLLMKTRLCTIFDCSKSKLRYEIYQARAESNNSRARLCQKELDNHNSLISKLLLQRSHKPIYWYDRVVESVFYGLDLENGSARPLHCYTKENILTLNQHIKHNSKEINANIIDSLQLRLQVLYLVYYFSLLYDDQCPVDLEPKGAGPFINDSPLGTYTLMKLIASKLGTLHIQVVDEFVTLCTITTMDMYRNKNRSQFSLLLMAIMLDQNAEVEIIEPITDILRQMSQGSCWGLLYSFLSSKFSSEEFYEYFTLSKNDKGETLTKLVKQWCIIRRLAYLLLFFGCNICKNAIKSRRLDRLSASKKESLTRIQAYINKFDKQFLDYLRSLKNPNLNIYQKSLEKTIHFDSLEDLQTPP